MTRREALALGAAAGVTATAGVPGAAFAGGVLGDTGAAAPGYLRRSTYVERVGEWFIADGRILTLVAVEDVAGAAVDDDLKGREDAFSLVFNGVADALVSSLYQVHHEELGPFPLFLGPTGRVRELSQEYNAIVDRTVRVKRATALAPEAPRDPAGPVARPATGGARDEGPGPAPGPPEPSARDLEIIEAREQALRAVRARRHRRARRAHSKLRRAHADRVTFLRDRRRKAKKRARKIRAGWLRRHGPGA
jgi:hypothetical protein